MKQPEVDVLIVGAGLSGIAAGYYLQTRLPRHRFAILESRDRLGGTWDLFRYPGIRSDSDRYTLGFSFRPWTNPQAIADGPDILAYLKETAEETGVGAHIEYNRRVERLRWSSEDRCWTAEIRRADGEREVRTARFLWGCTGYYRYDAGFTPDFPGIDRFGGEVVHPQKWPEDLDYTGKRVVVIGSGATAMTLVPAMADRAAHVTMLQRSPTFVVSLPRVDRVAEWLERRLPARRAHQMARWKSVAWSVISYRFARRFPGLTRRMLLKDVRAVLGEDFDVETHFSPAYDPWDQRVCVVPEGDLLHAIKAGRVSVVTDHIETFTETGITLRSGDPLQADLVVTATGLQLQFFGGATIEVDGEEVNLGDTTMYRGAMLCELPNAAMSLGYTNASWTLKCELACIFVCRVLERMAEGGHTECRAQPPGPEMTRRPAFDLDAGYVRRALGSMPVQGSRDPWRVHNNYLRDLITLGRGRLDDGVLVFR